jgi:hypothetical protein
MEATTVNILQHRANFALGKLASARTPAEKHEARAEAFEIKADLEKFLADDQALKALKAARPKSAVGMYKSDPVADHPVFMIGPLGTKITSPVKLPDGSMAAPNPQYQIVVPARFVPAMLARGFRRFNDDAFTSRADGMGNADPTRTNNA